jgi:hypothetical protein
MSAVRAVGDRVPELVAIAAEDVEKGMTFWGQVQGRSPGGISLMLRGCLVQADAQLTLSGRSRFEYEDPDEGPAAIWLDPDHLVLVEAARVP